MTTRNFLGNKRPNWIDFVVDELSFVDIPAVQDADIVALKRGAAMKVSETVEAMKALTAEQMKAIQAMAEKQGNVQALIDTWDEWAGSFTACVGALEGKEGIDNPQALCAWLHHEATGEWPAEG